MAKKVNPREVLEKIAGYAAGATMGMLNQMITVAPDELAALASPEASELSIETPVPLGNGTSIVFAFSVVPTPPATRAN